MSAGIRAGSNNDGYVQVNGNDIITALSGGNVGIGNTSPSTKLHVNGTITATAFAGAVTGTSSGNPTLTNGSNNRVITATGSNALTGEVALTFDGATLTVNGTSTDTPLILTSTNSNGAHMRFQKDGANKHFIGCGGGFTLGDVDDLSFRTVDNIIFGVGTSEKVRITGAGKLQVKSSATNTVSLALVDNDSSNEIWRVGQASDGDGYVEVLEDGGTVGCKLDASGNSFTMGNFGIGVASPSQILEVQGGSAAKPTFKHSAGWGALRVAGSAGGSGSGFIFANNYNGTIEEKWSIYLDGSTDALRFTAGPPETTSAEKVRINSDGKVGIGMTPARHLEVKDSTGANRIMNIRGTGTSGAFLAFLDANTTDDSKCRIGSIGGNSIGIRGDAHHFQDGAGNNKVVITSSRFLVGTTDNSGYNNRSAYFHNGIHGDAWNYISITGATNGGAGLVFGDSTGQNTGNYESYMYHDNTNNNFYLRTDQGNKTFTFDNNGDLNIGDGNLVVANTHGIDFSATANNTTSGASTDSELLDYYEEGTWTPYMNTNGSGTLSASYTKQTGTYTRIGRLVYIMFDMVVSNTPSGNAGYPMITGLPFIPVVGQSNQGGFPIPQFRDSSAMPVDARLYNSSYGHNQSSAIWIQYQNSSGTIQQPAGGTWWSAGRCQGEMVYYTS